MSLFALVIGIDVYDNPDIPRLPGCIADAYATTDWLLKLGAQQDSIFLHVSPGTVPHPSVQVRQATLDALSASVQTLSKLRGDRLFVAMSGHGLYVRGDGPIFLAQDYGSPTTKKNLKIEEYLDYFRSWSFKDQFVFYDACQNPTSVIGQLSPVQAEGPDRPRGTYDPLSGNALTVCYSAAPGQRAWAGDGRGVLMRHLLEELDTAKLEALASSDRRQNCIRYDWRTGARQLDLKLLFDEIVKPAIVLEAAAVQLAQSPFCERLGRAQTEERSPIFDLQAEQGISITLSINPSNGASEVKELRLAIPTPLRSYYLPNAEQPLKIPFPCRAPSGTQLDASCELKQGSEWRVVNSPLREKLGQHDLQLAFELQHGPSPDPRDPLNQLNVRIVPPGGGPPIGNIGHDYAEIATESRLGTKMPAGTKFEPHEFGPDISFDPKTPGAQEAANEVAMDWTKALRKHLANREFDVFLSRVGERADYLQANLMFVFKAGGAKSLGGFVNDHQVVSLTAVGRLKPDLKLSLAEIELHPYERIPPGPYRVSLELPWGDWHETVYVRDDQGPAKVDFPKSVGLEPLRNEWEFGPQPDASAPFMVSGDKGSTAVFSNTAGVVLGAFRVTGCDLVVRAVSGGLRVEPFSRTSLPEWDLIFTMGQIESIGDQELQKLLEKAIGLPQAELLLLAIGYAAQQRDAPDIVTKVLGELKHVKGLEIDRLLLNWSLKTAATLPPLGGNITKLLPDLRLPVLRAGAGIVERLAQQFGVTPPNWTRKLDHGSTIAVLRGEDAEHLVGGNIIKAELPAEGTIRWFWTEDSSDHIQLTSWGLTPEIEVVKEVRAITGLALKEAKDLLDPIEAIPVFPDISAKEHHRLDTDKDPTENLRQSDEKNERGAPKAEL